MRKPLKTQNPDRIRALVKLLYFSLGFFVTVLALKGWTAHFVQKQLEKHEVVLKVDLPPQEAPRLLPISGKEEGEREPVQSEELTFSPIQPYPATR